VRHEEAGGRGRVYVGVEENQGPSALGGTALDSCEVMDGTAQTVQLRHHEHVSLMTVQAVHDLEQDWSALDVLAASAFLLPA
jgi:hypothetical protein